MTQGTDTLHFTVRKAMHNQGVEAGASALVNASLATQGNGNKEMLSVGAKGLQANGAYQLWALRGDDANMILVTDLTADKRGRVSLRYQNTGGGHGLQELPAPLDPVTGIRALTIANGHSNAVLTADLTAPDSLAYLVKRNLSGANGVSGNLAINASSHKTQFNLMATGLTPSTDYLLALNGSVVQTNSTDAKGHLQIKSLMETPSDILAVHSVQLWDSASNAVLSVTLP